MSFIELPFGVSPLVRCTGDGSAPEGAERRSMAAKPPIDLTSLLSRAISGLRLSERVGDLPNVESARTRALAGRVKGAKAVTSVCPYCAVGCSTLAYVSDEGKLLDVEGNPDSPISGGHLCPKGSAIFGLAVNEARWTTVKYRAPYSTEWEDKPLAWALDRIAEKFKATRDKTFERTSKDGKRLNHTLGIASLGGATFGVEENYILQKLFKSCGVVSVENQARI
jgi:formate dehydrogenase major subunit